MRIEYLDQQKALIKKEVDRVIDIINYEKIQSIDLAKANIKYRIDEAFGFKGIAVKPYSFAELKKVIYKVLNE